MVDVACFFSGFLFFFFSDDFCSSRCSPLRASFVTGTLPLFLVHRRKGFPSHLFCRSLACYFLLRSRRFFLMPLVGISFLFMFPAFSVLFLPLRTACPSRTMFPPAFVRLIGLFYMFFLRTPLSPAISYAIVICFSFLHLLRRAMRPFFVC